MNINMQVPLTLKEYGLDESEFRVKVKIVSERAELIHLHHQTQEVLVQRK